MGVIKERNIKLEFNVTGYERARNSTYGIIVNVDLNPAVVNCYTGEYLNSIKLDLTVINNLDTYTDILDSSYDSITITEYPVLNLLFKDEYELINYLYDEIIKFAKENNLPLFFQDVECVSDSYSDMIMESVKNHTYSNEIVDSDDINNSYTIKWEISNYSIKISNRYLERTYFEVNKNNVNKNKLSNVLYKFWNEWNDIIPGKFNWC